MSLQPFFYVFLTFEGVSINFKFCVMRKTLLFLVGLIAMSLSGFSLSEKGYDLAFTQIRGADFTLCISLMN